MRKKSISAIIALIGLSSFVVLGSSPEIVGDFLDSVKGSSIAKIFLPENQNEVQNPVLRKDGKIPDSTILPNESAKITDEKNNAAAAVPDEIVYFILFNHLVGLKAQAEKESLAGKKPINYLELYKQQANLDDYQSQFLFQTADDCINAIKPINEEAKRLIDEARANFPDGKLNSPEDLPPPPKELEDLQKQKNQTVLNYKGILENYLGAVKFAEFDQFARQKITPQVTTNLVNREDK